MLKIQDVRKTFNGQTVLNDVCLTIGEKEMVSIMGKSGAGKSTLLAVMAGLGATGRRPGHFPGRDDQ